MENSYLIYAVLLTIGAVVSRVLIGFLGHGFVRIVLLLIPFGLFVFAFVSFWHWRSWTGVGIGIIVFVLVAFLGELVENWWNRTQVKKIKMRAEEFRKKRENE